MSIWQGLAADSQNRKDEPVPAWAKKPDLTQTEQPQRLLVGYGSSQKIHIPVESTVVEETKMCDHGGFISPITENEWWCGECEQTINPQTGDVIPEETP